MIEERMMICKGRKESKERERRDDAGWTGVRSAELFVGEERDRSVRAV
jgi:hypothetical protein